jgi:hypothetical protein
MSASSRDIADRIAAIQGRSDRGLSVIDSLQRSLEGTRYTSNLIRNQADQLEANYQVQRDVVRSQLRIQEQLQRDQLRAQQEAQERARVEQERQLLLAQQAVRIRQDAVTAVTGGNSEREQLLADQGVLDGLVHRELQSQSQLLRARGQDIDEKTFQLTPQAAALALAEQGASQDVANRLASTPGLDPTAYQAQLDTARRGLDGSGFFGNTVPSIGAAAVRGVGGLAGLGTSLAGQLVGSQTVEDLGADLARGSDRVADSFDVVTPEEQAAQQQLGQRVQDFTDAPSVGNALRLAGNVFADTVTNPAAINNLIEQAVGASVGGAGVGAAARLGARAAGLGAANAGARTSLARGAVPDANPLGVPAIAVGQGSSFSDLVQNPEADAGRAALGGAATIGLGAAGGALARGLGLQTVEGTLARGTDALRRPGQFARQLPGTAARGAAGEAIQEGFEGFGEGAAGEFATGGTARDALVAGAGGAAAGVGAGGVLGGGLGAARTLTPLQSAEQRNDARTAQLEQEALSSIDTFNAEQGIQSDAEVRIPLAPVQQDAVIQQLSPASRPAFLRNFINAPAEDRQQILQQFGEALDVTDTDRFQVALEDAADVQQFFAGVQTDNAGAASDADLVQSFSERLGVRFEVDDGGRVTAPDVDATRQSEALVENEVRDAQAQLADRDAANIAVNQQAAEPVQQIAEQATLDRALATDVAPAQSDEVNNVLRAPQDQARQQQVLSRITEDVPDAPITPAESADVLQVTQAPQRQRVLQDTSREQSLRNINAAAPDTPVTLDEQAQINQALQQPQLQANAAAAAVTDRQVQDDGAAARSAQARQQFLGNVQQAGADTVTDADVDAALNAPQQIANEQADPERTAQLQAASQAPVSGTITPELERVVYAGTPPDAESDLSAVPDVDTLVSEAPNSAALRQAIGEVRAIVRTTTGVQNFTRADLVNQDTLFNDFVDAESQADLQFAVSRVFELLDEAGIRDRFFQSEADFIAEGGLETGKKPPAEATASVDVAPATVEDAAPAAVSAPTEQTEQATRAQAERATVRLSFEDAFARGRQQLEQGNVNQSAVYLSSAMNKGNAAQRLQVSEYLQNIGLDAGNVVADVPADPRRSFFLRGPRPNEPAPDVSDLQIAPVAEPAPGAQQDAFDPETGEVRTGATDVEIAEQVARLEGYDLLQSRVAERRSRETELSPNEVVGVIRETLTSGLQRVQVRTFTSVDDPAIAAYRAASQRDGFDFDERTQGFVASGDSGAVIYVNPNLINTANQARLFAAHEVLGHLGLRARFGPQLNTALQDIATRAGGVPGLERLGETVGVSLRDQYPDVLTQARAGSVQARNILVEEVVAAGAELTVQERSVPQLVLDAISDLGSRVKEWLSRLPGVGRLFEDFSDADLMRLVRESKQAAQALPAEQGPDTPLQRRGELTGFSAPNRARKLTPRLQVLDSDGKATGETVNVDDPDLQSIDTTYAARAARARDGAKDAYEAILESGKNIVDFTGKVPVIRTPSTTPLDPSRPDGPSVEGLRLQVSRALDPFIKATANASQAVRVAERGVRRNISEGRGLTYDGMRNQARSFIDRQITELDPETDAEQRQRLLEFREQLMPSGAGQFAFENDISTDMRMTNYAGIADGVMRDELTPLFQELDDEIIALSQVTGIGENDMYDTVNSVLEALAAKEENDAVYFVETELSENATETRAALLEQLDGPERVGDEQARAIMEQVQQIVITDKGAETVSKERNAASAAVSGLSTKDADAFLQFVYNDRPELYDTALEKVRQIHGFIDAQREAEGRTNNQYKNWRAAYGFQYRLPSQHSTGQLRTEGLDQQTLLDTSVEKIPLDGNALDRLKAFAARTALNTQYNQVNKAVLLNAMASKGEDPLAATHRRSTANLYQGADIEVVDKQSPRYTELLVKQSPTTFVYTQPDSDTAAIVRFPQGAKKEGGSAISQIRGERFRSQAAVLNRVTQGMRWANSVQGRMIMRYSTASAVRSFFREIPTTASIIGSEFGPDRILPFLTNIWSNKGAAGGIFKYMRYRLLEDNDAINQLVAADPRMAEFHDYVQRGGLVTQLQALRPEDHQERFRRHATSSNVLNRTLGQTENAVEGTIGALTDALDASIRFAAYQEGLRQFNGNKDRAAAYAKDIANFERRGTYGDFLGSWFLFFNPAASGTARLVESLLEGPHGATMAAYAAGFGMLTYSLLHAISDEDDETGENLLEREGPGRSVTDLRFHLNDETTLALPIGFGGANGAFAVGMQVAAFLAGHQSMQQLSNHTLEVATTNALPFQVSRIPLINDKGEWQITNKLLDSVLPQVLRPLAQHSMNMNALGLEIYPEPWGNEAAGVNALSGAPRHIGTASEALAIALEQAGGPDFNPGTIQFGVSTYFKAVHELVEFGMEAANAAQGAPSEGRFVDIMPLLGGLASRPGKSDNFYGKAARVQTMINRWDKLEPGQPERVRFEQQEAPWIAPQYEIIKRVRRELRSINDELSPIVENASAGPRARRQAIQERDQARRQVQRDALAQLEALEE